jgi:sugar lactone lactonase YvrE
MSHRIHVDGLGFPEGPVLLPDGSIAFVDLLHANIRVYRDGRCRQLCALPGAPNGMRLGPSGALMVCNNGGVSPGGPGRLHIRDPQISGRLQQVSLSGEYTDFAVDLPGEAPWRPNDLVFTPEGEIVFTDPQNWEALSNADSAATYNGGQLLVASPDGEVRLLAKMTGFPNGLVFHPNGSLLVGCSHESRVVRFAWQGRAVGASAEWCRFDSSFRPDGMTLEGNRIFVTGSQGDSIAVLDLEGNLIEMVDTRPDSNPTNCCLDGTTLWVTLGFRGQLVSLDIARLLA